MDVRTASGPLAGTLTSRRALVVAAGVCGFAAATAVAAQVRLPLPFTPVPVTLQTLMVLLAGASLGPWAGAGSQGLYLALGACGAPVFAAGASGLGPTAGYLLAFPLAAWIVGWAAGRPERAALPAGLVAANLVILGLGALGLSLATGRSLAAAAMLGVLPFLPGDALKLAAAWSLARLLRRAWQNCARGGRRER